jgi:FG-GAP-like repeat
VQVWWQQAGGGFTTPTSYAVEHAGWEDMELGDVNGDGRIDIVITSGQGLATQALAVLPQLPGGGGFGTPIYRQVDTTWGSWGVAVGDINGDGRNDIVASHGGNSPTFISVFRQGADGSLPLGDKVSTYDSPGPIEIADMDGDGRRDIVVAHSGWIEVSLYRQQADGTLGAEERFPTNYANINPHALALGDVNGDGLRDIVIGNTVLLQKAAPRPAGASAQATRAGARWPVLGGWPAAR